jgi:transcription termination factor Rho
VLQRVTLLRRTLVQMKTIEAMKMLVKKLGEYSSNAALLERIAVPAR